MDQLSADEVVGLYESVGWTAYTSDPDLLQQAIERSTFHVTAREEGALVGIARCLSDDFSIFYLQDLLVRPEYQQHGIGRNLLDRCLTRFDHVRQRVLHGRRGTPTSALPRRGLHRRRLTTERPSPRVRLHPGRRAVVAELATAAIVRPGQYGAAMGPDLSPESDMVVSDPALQRVASRPGTRRSR